MANKVDSTSKISQLSLFDDFSSEPKVELTKLKGDLDEAAKRREKEKREAELKSDALGSCCARSDLGYSCRCH
ncbi:MAG: hypothetical protein FWD89_00185 [Firmicutes bacterium]|nr:hypothetical protein [Bacillota bacterium]MCL2770717.1 hypothetical protein [Bacillota bacterium]